MNKKTFTLRMFAACAILAAYSLPAVADGGVYLATDLGRSHFNGGDFDTMPGVETTNVSDTSSAYRFTVGYQFTPYFGVEAGYVDLGRGSVNSTFISSTESTDIFNTQVSAKGTFVALTGTWPIDEQWSLFARAGGFTGRLDRQVQVSGGSGGGSNTGWTETYGVGAKWNFLPHWSLRAGLDKYRYLANSSDAAKMLSLGVEWRFF